jgi:hypothetical protein
VRTFSVDLGAGLVDLARPVVVTVNGREAVKRILTPDVRVLLEGAARDRDRTMLYAARITVEVPAAAAD